MTFEDDELLDRVRERQLEEEGVVCETCGDTTLPEDLESGEHECKENRTPPPWAKRGVVCQKCGEKALIEDLKNGFRMKEVECQCKRCGEKTKKYEWEKKT